MKREKRMSQKFSPGDIVAFDLDPRTMRIVQDFDLLRLAKYGTVAEVKAASTDSILVRTLVSPVPEYEFRIDQVDFKLIHNLPVAQPCNA